MLKTTGDGGKEVRRLIAVYPELVGAMAKRNLTRSAIAKEIGITPRTLYSKLSGETDFTLSEARAIHDTFFPDMDKETLFAPANQDGA